MISCFQLLCLIGESFEEYSEDICGAVVNIRNKGDKLSLWTKEAGRPDAILKIGYVISCSQLNSRFIWCIIQGWDDTLLSLLGTYHNTRDAIQYISRYSSCTLQLNENGLKFIEFVTVLLHVHSGFIILQRNIAQFSNYISLICLIYFMQSFAIFVLSYQSRKLKIADIRSSDIF